MLKSEHISEIKLLLDNSRLQSIGQNASRISQSSQGIFSFQLTIS
jgi:hypothetical protein